ncbi:MULTISPECIES: holo-ACP synthase [Thioalkalivibrio]|uniref:Holo-[acyl-carrier-protein] synthase n=1 Tax=Thioalkalivibrio halophilus TaxID=252474 RepID=A0A1V3A0C8_9GAMM|nr:MULTISPECIES: holo-ACP synthase [Thioalkalivibrio]OOC10779.1 holo-[acyl-carrier-protein] synthase [Thioalkalivibrio halophilus]PYG04509.1 holo-[acyl-carrier protein] synthase [Thioalkalivibrio sp. ALE21]
MILGIGTDLVQVARMQALWTRHGERFAERILHPVERADLPAQDPAGFLARRFAAKEALSKALGCGVGAGMALVDAGVTHDARGRPEFVLEGRARATAERLGAGPVHLSISDERDYAQAFVIIERA